MHLAQFGCLAVAFTCAVLLEISAPVFVAMVLLVLTHSVLAYVDARYTEDRRRILPIEQTIHGFMDVLPLGGGTMWGWISYDPDLHLIYHSRALGDSPFAEQ